MTAPLYNEHYLNVLNSVYYDNIRQIERLSQTNQEIRQILISAQRGTRNNRSNRNHSHNNVNNVNNTNNVNNVNNRNYSRNYSYSRNNSHHHSSQNAARTYIDNVEEYAAYMKEFILLRERDHNKWLEMRKISQETGNKLFDKDIYMKNFREIIIKYI